MSPVARVAYARCTIMSLVYVGVSNDCAEKSPDIGGLCSLPLRAHRATADLLLAVANGGSLSACTRQPVSYITRSRVSLAQYRMSMFVGRVFNGRLGMVGILMILGNFGPALIVYRVISGYR